MTKGTILVVEDDTSLRRVIEFSLEEIGFTLIAAASGGEGLRLYRERRPDLVITDLQMPGMSGYELLEQIKGEDSEALVVIITAHGSIEAAVGAVKKGAYDFIAKPFGREELRLVVEKALGFRKLRQENVALKKEIAVTRKGREIVAVSEGMKKIFTVVDRVAASDATVLISGESGTGKELIARTIHEKSERADAPFVAVNCAAIPSELLESELFGHVRGAFTGAVKDRPGKFRQANGGTIFLDEIGELPIELQPKLLRALQEREIEPVGGSTQKIDVRVVAATNQDVEGMMAEGRFREDLYYRLAVIPIELPPLRRRKDDIPLLINHFLLKKGGEGVKLTTAAIDSLIEYRWPGNVRELENLIERLVVLRTTDTLDRDDLPSKVHTTVGSQCSVLNLPDEGFSLEELERMAVVEALERCGGNKSKAAQFLKIPRHTLIYRIEKYHIGEA